MNHLTIIIIAAIAAYIASGIFAYVKIREYLKENPNEVSFSFALMVFIPGVNTVVAICILVCLLFAAFDDFVNSFPNFTRKFFGLKK